VNRLREGFKTVRYSFDEMMKDLPSPQNL